jgi:hypothetical protein
MLRVPGAVRRRDLRGQVTSICRTAPNCPVRQEMGRDCRVSAPAGRTPAAPRRQFRLLERREVPAARRLAPVPDVPEPSLRPPPGRPRVLAREDRASGGDVHDVRQPPAEDLLDAPEALPVQPRRRRAGAGQPVEHQVVEQLVAREHGLRPAAGVGPRGELLDDPRAQQRRGVDEAVADRLRPGGLLVGVAVAVVPAVEVGQRGPLAGREVVERRRVGWDERRHDVDPGDVLRVLQPEPGADGGAPVAAGRAVAGVTQARHQLRPRRGDAFDGPAAPGRAVGEAVARERRDYQVERVGTGRQRPDHLEELDHGPGPPVRQDERERVRVRRADVQEVDAEAVEHRPELGQPVEAGLGRAPVVAVGPVPAQLPDVGERRALRPVVDGLRLRPPRAVEPIAQVDEGSLGDVEPEGLHRVGHDRHPAPAPDVRGCDIRAPVPADSRTTSCRLARRFPPTRPDERADSLRRTCRLAGRSATP